MWRWVDTAILAMLFMASVEKMGLLLAAACTLWVTYRWIYDVGDDKPTEYARDVKVPALEKRIAELTAELAAAKAELRDIANSTGCVDACPCWAKLQRKAERAIASGAHLTSEVG